MSGIIPKIPKSVEEEIMDNDRNTIVKTFSITKEEKEYIDNWIKEHARTCPILSNPATRNWLGSPIHYVFTPCSFCTSISIKCNCGAEFNVPSDPDLI
ncbi:MAG: hypothetical protein A3B99_01910 [Candidatus Yanofskybacteria bacterium RIFCSPHIGHO2_02_FULL_44_12b]|nr:MAG: hypothetical protein A3B99_01910 [Candidatus Yanofskybacteria bacterium RIFCSPHIGHO2_02_FULL_44_12b]